MRTPQKMLATSIATHHKLKEMSQLTGCSITRLLDLFLERHGADLLAELLVEASNAKRKRLGKPPLQAKWTPPPERPRLRHRMA